MAPPNYTEEDLFEAVFDVTHNGMSLNKSAQKHSVPKQTLSARMRGRGGRDEVEKESRLTLEKSKGWLTGLYVKSLSDLPPPMLRSVPYFDVREGQYGWIKPENTVNVDKGGIMAGFGLNSLVVGSAEPKKKTFLKGAQTRAWTSFIEAMVMGVTHSHGLQPLDNGVLNSLKACYRRELGKLVSLTDSRPVDKVNFIRCYARAREAAFTKQNIKSGWKVTGNWPISRRQAMNHPEIQEDRVAGPNSREIKDMGAGKSPTTRRLFGKAAHAFEGQQSQLAEKDATIASLQEELDRLKRGKKRKAVTNPNRRFITVSEALAAATTMFTLAFGLVLLPALGAAQYTVDPPTTAAPDTIRDCTYWQVAADNDTCAGIGQYWGITLEQFEDYNPSQADGCDLLVGDSYCIEENWGVPVATPTPSSSSISSSVSASSTTPTFSTPLEACQAVAYGYHEDCPRCMPLCENAEPLAWSNCFNSVFTMINGW
ncbi:hypothetical protein PG994_004075 [Apiospora phragmitis]|uniref:LysM domain-containing protein n=1 Tax=Apiospora phragmitis TaxID=2905665 RepID=A0ABR1VS98_9PEZI